MDLDDACHRPMTLASARDAGLTPGRLRGPLWRHPYRNVHVWSGLDADDPTVRAAEAALLLPEGAAIGGWAAAMLHGALDFDGQDRVGEPCPVLLCLSRPQQVTRRPGLIPWRSDLSAEDVVAVGSITVTSRLRTCFDLGRLAPGLEEAVVVLDASMRDLRVPLADLDAYARRRSRWRGVRQLSRALRLVDVRSASPGESRLRFVWVVEAGLPVPEVNCELQDGRGHVLGVPDLLDMTSGVVGEYDGGSHSSVRRRTTDSVRDEGLERVGLLVIRATAHDLGQHRRRLVWRLQDARRRGLARAGPGAWVLGPYRPPPRGPV